MTSGFVGRNGGILLQVAVNEAVLGAGEGPEEMFGSVTLFRSIAPRLFVQPALGAGFRATERGDSVDLALTFSAGAAANLGPVVLLGLYDLTTSSFEVGVAFNFRAF